LIRAAVAGNAGVWSPFPFPFRTTGCSNVVLLVCGSSLEWSLASVRPICVDGDHRSGGLASAHIACSYFAALAISAAGRRGAAA